MQIPRMSEIPKITFKDLDGFLGMLAEDKSTHVFLHSGDWVPHDPYRQSKDQFYTAQAARMLEGLGWVRLIYQEEAPVVSYRKLHSELPNQNVAVYDNYDHNRRRGGDRMIVLSSRKSAMLWLGLAGVPQKKIDVMKDVRVKDLKSALVTVRTQDLGDNETEVTTTKRTKAQNDAHVWEFPAPKDSPFKKIVVKAKMDASNGNMFFEMYVEDHDKISNKAQEDAFTGWSDKFRDGGKVVLGLIE